MKNFRQMSDPELANFAKNLEVRLAGHQVSCIDNDTADDLAAEIAPLTTGFEATIEESMQKNAAKESSFAFKRENRGFLLDAIVKVRNCLRYVNGPEGDYELCGFNYPQTSVVPIVPADPTNLVAVGTSNGVNTLTFRGNNASGLVVYEIWRRQGDTGDWVFQASVKRQTYTDTPVVPGQYYEYKVRAIAARNVSNWSNTAQVYGAI